MQLRERGKQTAASKPSKFNAILYNFLFKKIQVRKRAGNQNIVTILNRFQEAATTILKELAQLAV